MFSHFLPTNAVTCWQCLHCICDECTHFYSRGMSFFFFLLVTSWFFQQCQYVVCLFCDVLWPYLCCSCIESFMSRKQSFIPPMWTLHCILHYDYRYLLPCSSAIFTWSTVCMWSPRYDWSCDISYSGMMGTWDYPGLLKQFWFATG